MKILHTGDWHIGKKLEGRDRLQEQREALYEIADIALKRKIDVVIAAGDIFDTAVPGADAEALFYDALVRISDFGKRKVILIAGNHDDVERVTAAQGLARSCGIYLTGGSRSVELTINGETAVFALLSYPNDARMAEFERTGAPVLSNRPSSVPTSTPHSSLLTPNFDNNSELEKEETFSERVGRWFGLAAKGFRADTINIAVSHLFVLGGVAGGGEREIELGGAKLIDKKFLPESHYTALGHLHKKQAIDKERNIYYSGSILPCSFDETPDKCVVQFECSCKSGVKNVEFIPIKSGKRLTVLTSRSFEDALSRLENHRDEYVSLELALDAPLSDSENKRLKTEFPDLLKIALKLPEQEKRRAVNVRELSRAELFRGFYLRQRGSEPPAEVTKLFLELMEESG